MTETERYDAISACAEAAHELNKIYCVAHGDFSQVPWFMASDWQRGSAIKGVQDVLYIGTVKLMAVALGLV